jgi:hypothetical protein
VLAALVLGTGVSAAVVRSGAEPSSAQATPTTIGTTTTVLTVTTTTARPTTTRPPPTSAPTTTRPALTRAAATKALCADIDASVRLVAGGSTIGGGLRLLRAVNTYGDDADPTVVAPARRMLAAGLNGDLEAAAVATEAAASACRRQGFPISIPTSGPGPGRGGEPCGIVGC